MRTYTRPIKYCRDCPFYSHVSKNGLVYESCTDDELPGASDNIFHELRVCKEEDYKTIKPVKPPEWCELPTQPERPGKMENTGGMQIIPVANNHIIIKNDSNSMMLDIYDQPGTLGMQVSVYQPGEKRPNTTIDIPEVGGVAIQEIVDTLLGAAYIDGEHHKQWFIVEALKKMIPIRMKTDIDVDGGTPP